MSSPGIWFGLLLPRARIGTVQVEPRWLLPPALRLSPSPAGRPCQRAVFALLLPSPVELYRSGFASVCFNALE